MAKKETTKQVAVPPRKGPIKAKKKIQRTVPNGIVYVKSTFNNTIVTITDLSGKTIAWSSAGRQNFSNSRKSSAFAGTVAASSAAKEAMSYGMKECKVILNGPGAGRESSVRGIQSSGLVITEIKDATPVPHNGCRPRKRRRV